MRFVRLFLLLPFLPFVFAFPALAQGDALMLAGSGMPGLGNSVAAMPDGGWVVVGGDGFMGSSVNLRVIRFGASGELEWARTYENIKQGHGMAVAATRDGGCAVVSIGLVNAENGNQKGTAFLLKLGPEGKPQWTRILNLKDRKGPIPVALLETSDGNIVVIGTIQERRTDRERRSVAWAIEVDPLGEITRLGTIGFPNKLNTALLAAKPASDGGIWLTGIREGAEEVGRLHLRICVVRLSAEWDLLWSRSFNSEGFEVGLDLVETDDGGCILSGLVSPKLKDPEEPEHSDSDMEQAEGEPRDAGTFDGAVGTKVISLDAEGKLRWAHRYDVVDASLSACRIIDPGTGDYLLAGSVGRLAFLEKELALPIGNSFFMKLSDRGDILAAHELGVDSLKTFGIALAGLPDGGAVQVGIGAPVNPDEFSTAEPLNPKKLFAQSAFQIVRYGYGEVTGCRTDVPVVSTPVEAVADHISATIELEEFEQLQTVDVTSSLLDLSPIFFCGTREDLRPRLRRGFGTESTLQLSPNIVRAGGRVRLSFYSDLEGDILLTVTRGATGEEVIRLTNPSGIDARSGAGFVELQTEGYAAGVYLVQVEVAGKTFVEKLLVR